MREDECIEYLSSLEMKYPVEKWKINGRKVWPLIRFRLLGELMEEDNRIKAKSENKFFGRLKYIIQNICSLRYSINCKSPSRADVLVLHSNASRNIVLKNGKYYDKDLDPIIDFYETNNYQCMSLEVIYHFNNVRYPFYRVSKCINYDLLKCKIMARISCKKALIEMPEYDLFCNELLEKENVRLDLQGIYATIKTLNTMCEYFKDILKTKSIRLVVMQCWYSSVAMAIAMACYDLELPCVDIQHGLAGAAGHRAYCGWAKFDGGHRYEVMPSCFWSWLVADANVIKNWGCKDVYAEGVGKTMFLQNLSECFGSLYANKLREEIKKLGKTCILVSLQTATFFPKWFVEFIQEYSDKFIWIIRYHPCKDNIQLEFAELIKNVKNVYVDNIDTISLDFLLTFIDIHITIDSSVVMDAFFCKVPSIMLSEQYFYSVRDILSKDFVCYVNNKVDLLYSINEMTNRHLSNKNSSSKVLAGEKYLLRIINKNTNCRYGR